VVAISGDDFPTTTPAATGRRTRKNTAILLLLGFLSFASVSALPWLDPEEPSEERGCRNVYLTSDDGRFYLTNDDGTKVLTSEVCGPFH
jgi:hypothetical protein